MPSHYNRVGGRGQDSMRTGSASEFRVTKEIPYGATAGTTTGGFHNLFQSSWSYPNRIENLKNITIRNTGKTALEIEFLIDSWENATPDTNVSSPAQRILRHMLPVGEHIYLPNLRLLDFDAATSAGDAYALDNKNPKDVNSENLYVDSGVTVHAKVEDSATSITVTSGDPFYVGDLIQLGINTSETTQIEIMRVTKVDGTTLTVDRALYGTSAADGDSQTDATSGAVDGAKIYLPFFNITQDCNQYGGLSTCQTDSNGVFHIKNFFGYGRYANSVAGGLVPGSLSGKFFNAGYQELGLTGISPSTHSGLAASTLYGFDITVDGSGLLNSDAMQFTTDSSNVNFGGNNGIINKIQTVLNTQFRTTSSNVLNEAVSVGIVDGDIRFTSGQRLSTSAILLAAPSQGETTPFGVGRLPAIANVQSPVAASLTSDLTVDKSSGLEKINESIFFYDDGHGNIGGSASGTINYQTGELYLNGVPNAHFVVSANYGSAMAGGTRLASAGSRNSIHSCSARSLNQKINGQIEFIGYE